MPVFQADSVYHLFWQEFFISGSETTQQKLEHGQPLIHILAVLRGDVAAVAAQGRNAAISAGNLIN